MKLELTTAEHKRIKEDLQRSGRATYGIGGVEYRFKNVTCQLSKLGYMQGTGGEPHLFGLAVNPDCILGEHGGVGPVFLEIVINDPK